MAMAIASPIAMPGNDLHFWFAVKNLHAKPRRTERREDSSESGFGLPTYP
jgi:hypothetical protein